MLMFYLRERARCEIEPLAHALLVASGDGLALLAACWRVADVRTASSKGSTAPCGREQCVGRRWLMARSWKEETEVARVLGGALTFILTFVFRAFANGFRAGLVV